MNPLSLDDPQALLECPLSDLQSVVRAIDRWSDLDARQLDQVLRGRVLDLLAGRAEVEDLVALHRCMQTLVPHAVRPQLQAMDPDWIARWRAWADLLDGRIGQLQARDPSRVPFLPRASDLLEAVRLRPGLSRIDLEAHLGFPAHRLIRILEDHGRVDVREGRVFPAANDDQDAKDAVFAMEGGVKPEWREGNRTLRALVRKRRSPAR